MANEQQLREALKNLLTAIQETPATDEAQAEQQNARISLAVLRAESLVSSWDAQQPATGEPVWCVATGERVNGEETYTHHDAYVPLADCFPLYTRTAPSVPDDVARNAERWRHAISDGGNQSMSFIDIFNGWDGDGDFVEAFDAAMLAAKKETP